MAEIRFTVPGVLPGWQRAGTSGKRHYTQEQTRAAELEVAAWGRQAASGRMLAGELGMEITVYRAAKPTNKPDCDNLGKLVADALNKVVYKDDAQITRFVVEKRQGPARCEVRIWEREGDEKAV